MLVNKQNDNPIMADKDIEIVDNHGPNANEGGEFTLNRPKWTGYFKIIEPLDSTVLQTDNQSIDGSLYSNVSWYQFITYGSAARLNRYREYDMMDSDVDITKALDVTAEEICGNRDKKDIPLVLNMINDSQMPKNSAYAVALNAALRKWCKIQRLEQRLFPTARKAAKYGDCLYLKKDPLAPWTPLHPKQIIGAIVDKDDVTRVLGYQVRLGVLQAQGSESIGGYQQIGNETNLQDTQTLPASQVIRFSINTELADTAPFGESILQSVYRTFRQKQLLEDAIIIYRISRAPERRAFYIDTSGMAPNRVQQYLESVKNDLNQRRIPSTNAGGGIESTYNPMQTMDDYYFAVREDGKGSRVEVIPGGNSTGVIDDLEFFEQKMFRGLRIPLSYIKSQADNPAIFNDGKIGTAYIEELRFAQYIERLQQNFEEVLDAEFKEFVRAVGLTIDPNSYYLTLPAPSNFGIYRETEMNAELLNLFSTSDSVNCISKRFAMQKYLKWTETEIATNEHWKRQELGLKQNDATAFRKIYDNNYEEGEAGLGGGSMRDLDTAFGGGGMTDLGMGEEEGMEPGLDNANDEGNLNAGANDKLDTSGAEKPPT